MTNTTRIGLEVHIPLDTQTKLYCPCPATPHDTPNVHLCPTCTGQPGARPQGVNQQALEHALHIARILGCTPQGSTIIQRKHYVYPDLPNNYQRTSTPIGRDGTFWHVGIEEVHIEEDPGAFDPDKGTIDLNRSGRPLVEIVTRPDLSTPQDVDTWLDILDLALSRAHVSQPEAQLKADVNVSTDGGDRVEVKNVVGGRNAKQAATYEIQRQTRLRDQGDPVPRETRHFDEATGTTISSRKKETVGDYRYMPDPDLPPLNLEPIQQATPTPTTDIPSRIQTLTHDPGLTIGESIALLEDPKLETLFDEIAQRLPTVRAIDIVLHRVRGELDYRDATFDELAVSPTPIVDLAEAWHNERITKHVFTRLLRDHLDGADIQHKLATEAETDTDLEAVIETTLEEHPDAIQDYKDGKDEALNFLVGKVLQSTQGRANPKTTRQRLQDALEHHD